MSSVAVEEEVFWIFGYGSLIWRTYFGYLRRVNGYIKQWKRVWYQGSTDHRGTPTNPGRVVTLIPDQNSVCWGSAFCVPLHQKEEVIKYLDYREKGGYSQTYADVFFIDEDHSEKVLVRNALVYIATSQNPEYLGPAPTLDIARAIRYKHRGKSSLSLLLVTSKYLQNLANSLRDMKVEEDQTFELEKAIESILNVAQQ